MQEWKGVRCRNGRGQVAGMEGGKLPELKGVSCRNGNFVYISPFRPRPNFINEADVAAPLAPMDEDRRRFLSEALQSLTTDHVKRLQQLMDTLAKPDEDEDGGQDNVEEKEDALEELIGTRARARAQEK